MKFCNSQYVTALLLLLLGKQNSGSESVPGTFLSICLYADNGHITEPLILNSGTSITLQIGLFCSIEFALTSPSSPMRCPLYTVA